MHRLLSHLVMIFDEYHRVFLNDDIPTMGFYLGYKRGGNINNHGFYVSNVMAAQIATTKY